MNVKTKENLTVRLAEWADAEAISQIYEGVHTAIEAGLAPVGWIRGVYPTRKTVEDALGRGDMFVMENECGKAVGCAVINQTQVDVYEGAPWTFTAPPAEVMVLHTLAICREEAGKGLGKAFVKFYEDYALAHGCRYLRMDTNEINIPARGMYRSLGYREIGIVPCVFNGIDGVNLVLLEKTL